MIGFTFNEGISHNKEQNMIEDTFALQFDNIVIVLVNLK